jgi:hypothetical protein
MRRFALGLGLGLSFAAAAAAQAGSAPVAPAFEAVTADTTADGLRGRLSGDAQPGAPVPHQCSEGR